MRVSFLPVIAALVLSACNGGEPATPNDPDPTIAAEPAAAAQDEAPPAPTVNGGLQGTELRDAIQQPLDRAAAVSDTLQQGAENTAAQIEAAEREAGAD